MNRNPDLAEADADLQLSLYLKAMNDKREEMGASFHPAPHLGNRALRRQAAKNRQRKPNRKHTH